MAAMLTPPPCQVGEDIFGKDTVKNFESLGVDTQFLTTTSERATGCAPIVVNDSGQNSIIVVCAPPPPSRPNPSHPCAALRGACIHSTELPFDFVECTSISSSKCDEQPSHSLPLAR